MLALHPKVGALFDRATDTYERAFRAKPPLTPPWRIRQYVGPFRDPVAYQRSGARQVEGLRALGVVSPSSRVLDVGCGTGRVAAALTSLIGENGSYEGIDPQPVPIAWCRHEITPRFPRFRFHETRTFSTKYNPGGTTDPEAYRLPFSAGSFDLVLLVSVVTHVSRGVERALLEESRRVIADGGHVVLTEYLLDEQTRPVVAQQRSVPVFPHALGDDRTQTPGTPEGFVARDDAWVRTTWRELGFRPSQLRRGSWAGPRAGDDGFTERYSFYQDTIVLETGPR